MKFDFNQILQIGKRYWVIIVFCLVMIAALVAIPTFVTGQKAALAQKLDARKKVNDSIEQVLQKPRHQPVVSLDTNAAAPVLDVFPNERVIASGISAIQGVAKQSTDLRDKCLQLSIHALLMPDSLPVPRDPFQFRTVYLQQFQTEIPKLLVSVTPPTDEEIRIRQDQETQKLTDEQPHTVTGEVWNKEVLQQNIAMMKATLPEKMRQDAALQHKMYMAPTALSLQPALAPSATGAPIVVPDAESIWFAQMGLWIQQDVVKAIADLNKSSTKVADSPVKQLVQIYIPTDRTMYILPGATMAAPTAAPGASAIPPMTDTDPFPVSYPACVTGRVSNGVFDVVHFYLVLNVQSPDVERVIQELERDRLLTVCQSEVESVNSARAQLDGYYFGKTPVVTLTLMCEELFMRDWTHNFMPDSVKRFLNVDQQAAQAVAPAATPGR